jgi:hypothetical protein
MPRRAAQAQHHQAWPRWQHQLNFSPTHAWAEVSPGPATLVTSAHLRRADTTNSASPDLCLGIRMSSTSPGLATVVTRCTSGVFRLPLASLWRRFPARAGRFQSSTFGDYTPLRSLAIVLPVCSRRYRMTDQLRLVRSIALARRSCLVQSKGQPSATMLGIDEILGKSSPFQVHRTFSMLVSRDLVRVDGVVKFDGAVNGGEVDASGTL